MSVSYRIDHDKKTLITTIVGAITEEEMIAIQKRMQADPEFYPDYSHLIDCRKVGELKSPPGGLEALQHLACSQQKAIGHLLCQTTQPTDSHACSKSIAKMVLKKPESFANWMQQCSGLDWNNRHQFLWGKIKTQVRSRAETASKYTK